MLLKGIIHDKKKAYKFLIIGCVFLACISIANCLNYNIKTGIGASDFIWVWKECACALKGIDVMYAIKNGLMIDGIGVMPPASATVPWARIIGNLVHPGFLPQSIAIVYGHILYYVTIIFTWIVVTKKILCYSCFENNQTIVLSCLILLMPFYWTDAVCFLNNGMLFAFLLILVAILSEEHEYLCGFLLAIAMIKPQIALLFYITLLFQKKFKVILTSGVYLILSWVIYLLYVGGNPLQQLFEMIGQSTEKSAGYIWFGLMDGLVSIGFSGTVAMIFSMLIGIALTVALTILVQKSRYHDNSIILYSIPAFFSTVWCYKSGIDLVILCFPSLLIFYYLNKQTIDIAHVLISLIYLFFMNVKVFSGGMRRIIGYDWILGCSLDAWVRLFIFVGLIYLICRGNKDEDNFRHTVCV